MSNVKTLTELKASSKDGRGMPYSTQVVKVSVMKIGHTASFTSSTGEDMKMVNFSVADTDECALATLSDMTKASSIKEGATLHLRNFMWKGKIVLTKNSKIYMAPKMEIPEAVKEQAIQLICPPSPLTPVKKIAQMPSGKLATVKGRVVKDECVKTVKVQTVDTDIHTIRIEDEGEEINVSLWRDLAQVEVRVGDFVQVTQCVKGEYLKKPQLNSTRNTVVSKVEMPAQEICGFLEGLSQNGDEIEMAINADGKYEDYITSKKQFLEALHLEKYEEEIIMNRMPLKVALTVKGADVVNLTVL